MSKGLPSVPLHEIATPVQRAVAVVPGNAYRTLGVKWWGEGAYERDIIDGSQTAAITLNEVREGDLIINKIWVRHGSVAIVGPKVDGCVGSNEFPTFDLNRRRVLPRWLHWYTKTRNLWQKCAALSQGTSGKNRIRPERFLSIDIPLPPLDEQRRIVTTIEGLAARIEECRAVHTEVVEDCAVLCRSILSNDPASPAILTPMSEMVSPRAPDVSVAADGIYHFAGVYCFGKGVFAGQRKTGLDFAYKNLTQLRMGDFVYPKLMAWEGALGIVPSECDGLCVSPEYPVFSVNTERVLPEVLDVYFRSPPVWPQLAEISTGTNMRRRRLHPSSFLAFKMPLPPMETQRRLREVKTRLDSLADVQSQSAAELDALLPSILDKAFEGGL